MLIGYGSVAIAPERVDEPFPEGNHLSRAGEAPLPVSALLDFLVSHPRVRINGFVKSRDRSAARGQMRRVMITEWLPGLLPLVGISDSDISPVCTGGRAPLELGVSSNEL